MPIQPEPSQQLQLSVQDPVESALAHEIPIVFNFAATGERTPQWPSRERDIYLDEFWRSESILAGAVYSMVAKIAALDYKITGPRAAVQKSIKMLQRAHFGAGWLNFIQRVALDLFTQDNGAFIELCRAEGAGPMQRVLEIAHIDSQQCSRTGDPDNPVDYTNPFTSDVHRLNWADVVPMSDMPSSRERHAGAGFCAISRVLQTAQLMRDIARYKRQKLSGKRIPAILFVQGVRRGVVEDALTVSKQKEIVQAGRTLYTGPAIISTSDPGMPVDAKLIELAGLPDGYDEDTLMKWYIGTIAMGFGTDYSEFAPLPGGNLGTASQVESMSARSRGKGPGVVLQQVEHAMNYSVLPSDQEFQFSSTDAAAERERIMLRHERARERALRVGSQELTPIQALQLAVQEGDAPEQFLADAEGISEEVADETETFVRSVTDIKDAWDKVEMDMRRRGIESV